MANKKSNTTGKGKKASTPKKNVKATPPVPPVQGKKSPGTRAFQAQLRPLRQLVKVSTALQTAMDEKEAKVQPSPATLKAIKLEVKRMVTLMDKEGIKISTGLNGRARALIGS